MNKINYNICNFVGLVDVRLNEEFYKIVLLM